MKVLTIVYCLAMVQGYVMEIKPREEECFIEYVKTKSTAFLRIAVLSGGNEALDIRLKAYGPFAEPPTETQVNQEFFNQIVTTKTKEGSQDVLHDGFNFETEHRGGWYKYCLDNQHSSWNTKTVDFMTSHGLTFDDDVADEDIKEDEEKKGELSRQSSIFLTNP